MTHDDHGMRHDDNTIMSDKICSEDCMMYDRARGNNKKHTRPGAEASTVVDCYLTRCKSAYLPRLQAQS